MQYSNIWDSLHLHCLNLFIRDVGKKIAESLAGAALLTCVNDPI